MKLASAVTSYMACGDAITDAAAIEPGTVVACPGHGEQEIVPAAPGHTGAFHGVGQHPGFCPGCRAERAQAAAEGERLHDARITSGVTALPAVIQDAGAAVSKAEGILAALVEEYAGDLVEGPDARDLAHELGEAARSLRRAARIARHRASLLVPAASPAAPGTGG